MKAFLHLLPVGLLLALVVALKFLPAYSGWISAILIVTSLAMALFFILNHHLLVYRLGNISRAQFLRNLLLDLLGLLLGIAAASYLGGFAGMRLGESHGGWAGLIAGMAVAFLAAWGTRRVWGRAVGNLMGWPAG
jgi:hypothetical protein